MVVQISISILACPRRFIYAFVLLVLILAGAVEAKFKGESTETCEAGGACGVATEEEELECFDLSSNCEQFFTRGGIKESCILEFPDMREKCRKSCHLCDNKETDKVWNIYSEDAQKITGMDAAMVWEYSAKVDDYMYNQVYVDEDDKFKSVRADCVNQNELCLYWAAIGECEANPDFMTMQCAPSCLTCDKLSFEMRCPYDPNDPMAWSEPGDLNAMFTRIVTDPEFQQYQPTILSQPDSTQKGILNGPWVVVLDNFLSQEECDTLIELGAVKGYERSQDVGARKFDGTFDGKESSGRTSTNAWCTEECWEHATTQLVHDRMHHLIQVPPGNYEYLQLLRCKYAFVLVQPVPPLILLAAIYQNSFLLLTFICR
jgi:prolyl 4-hydroxylase